MNLHLHLSQSTIARLESISVCAVIGIFAAIGIMALMFGATATKFESANLSQIVLEFCCIAGLITYHFASKLK